MKRIYITEDKLKVIQEELSIADVVVESVDKVHSIINQMLDNGKNSGSFDIELFRNYTVNILYDFREKTQSSNESFGGSSFKEHKIVLYLLIGQAQENADTIQHEIEHLFQQYKRNKSFLNDNNEELYSIALTYQNSANEFVSSIGKVIYHSFQFEEDAIINGFYAHIIQGLKYMENNDITRSTIDALSRNTYLHAIHQRMIEWEELFKENEKETTFFLKKYYHKNLPWLLKLCKKTVSYIEKKMFKVKYKIYKDCNLL